MAFCWIFDFYEVIVTLKKGETLQFLDKPKAKVLRQRDWLRDFMLQRKNAGDTIVILIDSNTEAEDYVDAYCYEILGKGWNEVITIQKVILLEGEVRITKALAFASETIQQKLNSDKFVLISASGKDCALAPKKQINVVYANPDNNSYINAINTIISTAASAATLIKNPSSAITSAEKSKKAEKETTPLLPSDNKTCCALV